MNGRSDLIDVNHAIGYGGFKSKDYGENNSCELSSIVQVLQSDLLPIATDIQSISLEG